MSSKVVDCYFLSSFNLFICLLLLQKFVLRLDLADADDKRRALKTVSTLAGIFKVIFVLNLCFNYELGSN